MLTKSNQHGAQSSSDEMSKQIEWLCERMPAQYRQITSSSEKLRHASLLKALPSDGLAVTATAEPQHCLFEIMTTDWDEPGLLEKLFEVLLLCYHLPQGVHISRVRIFTGTENQVINLLELTDAQQRCLKKADIDYIDQHLQQVSKGTDTVLESIRYLPVQSLIPLPNMPPQLDFFSTSASIITLTLPRISNRYTSILLHYLARSSLWWHIQAAEFKQEQHQGVYRLYVVDKNRNPLRDQHLIRRAIVETFEKIHATITRFNLHYLQRQLEQRIQRNDSTVYHSRPNSADVNEDLHTLQKMMKLSGFATQDLQALVSCGYLAAADWMFLQHLKAFVQNQLHSIQNADQPPTQKAVEVFRQYLVMRERSIEIIEPVITKLSEVAKQSAAFSPQQRLAMLVGEQQAAGYCLDKAFCLQMDPLYDLETPAQIMKPFWLMACTGCTFEPQLKALLQKRIEMLQTWVIKAHASAFGKAFLEIIGAMIAQGNTGQVLRQLRQMGFLAKYIPAFSDIQGLIHLNEDHRYTVDEHSIMVAEGLQGLQSLHQALPEGTADLEKERKKLTDETSLKQFAIKHMVLMQMLWKVPIFRLDRTMRQFFQLMTEARNSRLEDLQALRLFEHSQELRANAIKNLQTTRHRLLPFMRFYCQLNDTEKTTLTLAALLHDIKKPHQAHPRMGADMLGEVLEKTGMELPLSEQQMLEWLIAEHLSLAPMLKRMEIPQDGQASADFIAQYPSLHHLRMLILFTLMDRLAVSFSPNKNQADIMVLSMLFQSLTLAESKDEST